MISNRLLLDEELPDAIAEILAQATLPFPVPEQVSAQLQQ